MALTKERANILTELLNADMDRANKLLALEAGEALEQINALGNDFTLDEIVEYGEAVKKHFEKGELDANSLDDVSGGFITAGMAFSAGLALGAAVVNRAW